MENDILIENSTATWIMPLTNGELGGTYTGTFMFRCYLSPVQQLQAGREYREFLGSHAVLAENHEANLAYALTQLKHRIIKAPPFWTSTAQDSGIAGNVGDLNVISMVLDAALVSETMFKERIQKERDKLLDKTIKVAEELLQKERE